VLGILIDHLLRWWHKHLARNDAQEVDEWLDGGPDGARDSQTGGNAVLAPAAADGKPAGT
jgi:hypothetical protein